MTAILAGGDTIFVRMITRSAILITSLFVCAASCLPQVQTPSVDAEPAQPKSLADVARASKKDKKEPVAKIVLTEDSPGAAKGIIPDVFSDGMDNSDDILKAILDYSANHNAKETEGVVRIWFEKHDAMLANAIEQSKRIEQRERDRQNGYLSRDVQYRSQQEYAEAQRVEIISRRDDLMQKQENGLLSARIQQTFGKVRSALAGRHMKYDWFKIRCGNGNCSF